MATKLAPARAFEWPTLVLLLAVYLGWVLMTLSAGWLGIWAMIGIIPLITLHSSLQHETLHILEPRWPLLALLAVFPAIGLFVPYLRFRDTHLAHHVNEVITDPYDDPETGYLAQDIWNQIPRATQRIMRFNNTLAGRLIIGPIIGQIIFMRNDWHHIKRGNRQVLRGWLWHIPAVIVVFAWIVLVAEMPVTHYLIAAYFGMSLLKIRTFLEHRAHETVNGRSVIIEDRGPLAFLFLNNNYHAAHHAHPTVPWYNLRGLYFHNKRKFLQMNGDYLYHSYWQVLRAYFWRAKEPVAHPFWRNGNDR